MEQQYLSTDPNAGQEQKYLSTDPNAGKSSGGGLASLVTGEQPRKRTLKDITDDMPGDEVAAILMEQDDLGGQMLRGAASGGLAPAGMTRIVAEPARRVIHGIAKAIMTKALGSQAPVAKRFPGVDLAEAALEHGTNPKTVESAGRAAAQEVRAAGQASTAAPITPREIIGGLRPVYDRAAQAERGGIANAMEPVRTTISQIRKVMPRTGVSMDDALAAKSEWQTLGKAAQRALPGELKGADARTANAVGKRFTEVIRGRGDQRINSALDESQKLMALQQAVQAMASRPSLLQLILGTAGGAMSGGVPGGLLGATMLPLVTSPRGLSMMAQGVKASEPAAAPALEGVYRALLGAADNSAEGPRR